MRFVYPIREHRQIEFIKRYLRNRNERDYILFLLGIHSGLRISDLLSLKARDVLSGDRLIVKEIKTGKTKSFPMTTSVRKEVRKYAAQCRSIYLFPSRKGRGAITRQQAYLILNRAAQQAGIEEPIGTHTLRKTFAYWAYKQGASLELIQKILNHSSSAITLRYLGITQEEIDEVYLTLTFSLASNS